MSRRFFPLVLARKFLEKSTEKLTDSFKSKSSEDQTKLKSINKSRSYGAISSEKESYSFSLSQTTKLLGETKNQDFVDEHSCSLDEILDRYDTDANLGLQWEQVVRNRRKYGKNILKQPDKPRELLKFFNAVVGGLNSLLWLSAILSLGSYYAQFIYSDNISKDNLHLAIALVVVIHISGFFTYFQEYKSSKIMEKFKNMAPKFAYVTREGRKLQVNVGELVVGDIVHVQFGNLIPADLRLIECQNFTVDNSSLTGESEPAKRSAQIDKKDLDKDPMEAKNLAFFSTNALEGVAKGIVLRVGSNTIFGRLANLASSVDKSESPIGVEMNRFIVIMTIRSIIFGGIFFFISIFLKFSTFEALFFVIGIVVANVPEGLAVTFTMCLSIAARRLGKKFCLVKHLQSVEALGSTTVICTDKTGTLTQNNMCASHFWINDELFEADTLKTSENENFLDKSDSGFLALSTIASLCSRANFINDPTEPDQEEIPIFKRKVEGDASEAAILKWIEFQVGNVAEFRRNREKVCEIPFNSKNKFQVSIHNMSGTENQKYLLVMKGAPEKIISLCNRILIKDVEYKLDENWKHRFEEVCLTLAKLGERVIGFCDCRLSLKKYPIGYEFDSENPEFLDEGFRLVGLISMIDPPKPTVPDAVMKCRQAGIRVIMVTGDHPVTASAIAKAVGIFSQEEVISTKDNWGTEKKESKSAVITGTELIHLSKDQLKTIIRNYPEIVFARTSPEQKYLIVEGFQELGYIVAVTGDGVNDSPALKKADIGISMGISGSEVSKETAELILMDDNFATIVNGVEEGRLIFDNLKKLIAYNLADNIAEMYSVWLFILLKIPLPMGTLAMLITVLGTDIFPAISLAHETAEKDIMKLKPRNAEKDRLVSKGLLSYTYGQSSVIEVSAAFFTYFVTYAYYGWLPSQIIGIQRQFDSPAVNDLEDSYGQDWTYAARQELALTAQTGFFAAIVVMQASNLICCKTRRLSIFQKGMGNWRMNIAIIFEFALAFFLIYTPSVNSSINFKPIEYVLWLPSIPFAIFLLIFDELRKFWIREKTKRTRSNKLKKFQYN